MPNYLIYLLLVYVFVLFLYIIFSMQYIKKYKENQELGSLINDCLILYPYTNLGVLIFGLLSYVMTLVIFVNCIILLTISNCVHP